MNQIDFYLSESKDQLTIVVTSSIGSLTKESIGDILSKITDKLSEGEVNAQDSIPESIPHEDKYCGAV